MESKVFCALHFTRKPLNLKFQKKKKNLFCFKKQQ